jgi:hypothetical protein
MSMRTDYEALAAEIREKRQYREEMDGTVYCSRRNCAGSTGLRCQRTGVPICKICATKTPVGYISQEAARAQQDLLFNAETSDYLLAGGVAFLANLVIGFGAVLLGSLIWSFLGFFGIIFAGLISTGAAGLISQAIFVVLRGRRGRYTVQVVTAAVLVSSLPLLIVNLIVAIIYTVVVISTIRARFSLTIRIG